MVTENVKQTFEKIAEDYDELIRKVVPQYEEQHDVILSLIPFDRGQKINVLDLGAGTGPLAELVLRNFSQAHVEAMDLSEKMLEVCARRLAKFEKRFVLRCQDFEHMELRNKYDVVMAGLAIHHLSHEAKRRCFSKIREALNPGGVLIIRDLVKGPGPRLDAMYEELWDAHMRKNGVEPEKIRENGRKNDIPATMQEHLNWLRDAGFEEVDCVWRFQKFAIFAAFKG